ncbi:MAG: metal ABC transporter ATP-binding protein [Chloroflexota bacterium]
MQQTLAHDYNLAPHAATRPALEVNQLSAGYPSDRYAVENLSFTVQRGERVAIIGPNGAGKSTMFKAIVGLIPFTHGEISIHGEDCRTSHSMVGYVPQHEAIDWSFPVTVTDVVMMGRTRQIGWFRLPGSNDRVAVHDILEMLGLSHLAKRQIGELSGGQKRRVFIARALAQQTDILLMDEPFTGVDSTAEQEIMAVLDVLTEQNITILLATHNMNRAAEHFGSMLLMNRCNMAYGPPSEVLKPEVLRQAYSSAVRVVQDGTETLIIADEHGHAHGLD